MENHPIPQDVTGFKFRLIGSLTIKQFLYLLGAGALAGAVFILPISVVIKIPFIALPVLTGLGLAFVPVEGRPMDVMIINFLKALPSENRYMYHKLGAEALIAQFFSPAVSETKQAVQQNTQDARRKLLYNKLIKSAATYKPDPSEEKFLSNISSYFDEAQKVPAVSSAKTVPQKTQIVKVSLPAVKPQTTAVLAPRKIPVGQPPQQTASIPKPSPNDVKPAQTQTIAKPPTKAPPMPKPPPPVDLPLKKRSPEPVAGTQATTAQSQLNAGFPSIPDTPNVAMGIIRDPRGKILPNILVEIVDKNNTPVRAFKTNALGQFASATPLPNGEYNILFDDPKKVNEFPPVSIKLTGEIFQPLEIISTDQREKLRQELFGTQRSAQSI